MLFEFENGRGYLKLLLWIGPGDSTIRQRLLEHAFKIGGLLKPRSKNLGKSWNSIFSKTFLRENNYPASQEIESVISDLWPIFLKSILPTLVKAYEDFDPSSA